MAEGRGRADWARHSVLLAMIANANRDPKKTRAFKPADFDPYARRDRRDEAIELMDMGALKSIFAGQKAGGQP